MCGRSVTGLEPTVPIRCQSIGDQLVLDSMPCDAGQELHEGRSDRSGGGGPQHHHLRGSALV